MLRSAFAIPAVALAAALLLARPVFARDERAPPILEQAAPGSLLLADARSALPIVVDPDDAEVVRLAAADLQRDIAAVYGSRPVLRSSRAVPDRPVILMGTIGRNALLDDLIARGRLKVAGLRGAWESFVIALVDRPWPGVDKALIVIGSDRRGTAFGVYELSRAFGVSPWHWWADLKPRRRSAAYVARGSYRFGPPSVQYRGIFINDEDWGLYPWAAQTFEPETGNIGPKTYSRVFELMLRLKANTLWPAMHKTTRPFNADHANAKLAEDWAIVMGSSHAEAMLRNNVGEWTGDPSTFNYVTNREGVRSYWEARAIANARYESVWTLGMRGLHDTGMVGATTARERAAVVAQVLRDQRDILDRHVPGGSAGTAQIFVPYKEALDVYRAGLKVPDNVTIVWPDDNFGYIRQFPTPAEANRAGGAGIYYHLSYLGYPLSYLWLSTTPPALVQEEMTRAWDRGARRFWMVNVGDIKPAEIGMSHFLELGWNIDRVRRQSQSDYLAGWLGDMFGASLGHAAADLMDAYFQLNMVRRPEHLEWPAHEEDRHLSTLTPAQVDDRLRRLRRLAAEGKRLASLAPADRRDAWFELIEYPTSMAAAANLRFFAAERFDELIEVDPPMARSAGGAVALAEQEIAALTVRYNEAVAGGKWRGLMAAEPADSQWRIYRPRPVVAPAAPLRLPPDRFLAHVDASPPLDEPTAPATGAKRTGRWTLVKGLGRGGGVQLAGSAGSALEFELNLREPISNGSVALLPLFPEGDERELVLSVSLDGATSQRIVIPRTVGDALWVQGVLDNRILAALPFSLPAGRRRVVIRAESTGIAVDGLVVHPIRDGRASR